MLQTLRLVVATSSIRTATLTLFCLGTAAASAYPYLSLVAIQQLGFSAQGLGVLLFISALATTLGAIIIGHISDELPDRKRAILLTLVVGAASFWMFSFFPGRNNFLFVLLFGLPLASSAFGQLFAVIRQEAAQFAPGESASINSVVRAIFAGAWILVPGAVGAYVAATGTPSDAYWVAGIALLIALLVYGLFGANGGRSTPPEFGRWQGLIKAFALIAAPFIMWRLLALALIGVGQHVNAALMPLLITGNLGGSMREVGIYAGLVAGLEIPFMLIGAAMALRFPLYSVIVAGALAHVTYLLLLSATTSLGIIFFLAIVNAAGSAILLSLHLGYVQALLPDRPGLGTSLLSVGLLLSRIAGAAIVGGVGAFYSHTGALILAACGIAIGAVLFTLLDRRST